MTRLRVALSLLLALSVAACSGVRPAADGRASGYSPGVPDFDLDAVVLPSPEAPAVRALVSIPYASLVFVREDSLFRAVVRTSLVLETRDGRPLASPARVDTVRVGSFDETLQFLPLVVSQDLAAETGRLVLRADIEDVQTGRVASRLLAVPVPDLDEGPSLSAPRLSGRIAPRSPFVPLVALGVPASLDSLRARVDVIGETGPVTVVGTLLRLQADTASAPPPNGFTPGRGTLRARGVSLRDPDTVAVSRQRVASPATRLTAELSLPSLSPGVYRIEMDARVEGSYIGESVRTFVVRPQAFPKMVGIEALVEPLEYIATAREMNRLRSADPDSLREAFDAFWGRLFNDRSLAAATLQAYYERVEEANRQFSIHTDGWKTDRGLVYILYGPPERVENRFDSEVWVYSATQSAGTFVFERTARRDDGRAPFDVWTLQRDRAYDAGWRRAIRLWRRGQIP